MKTSKNVEVSLSLSDLLELLSNGYVGQYNARDNTTDRVKLFLAGKSLNDFQVSLMAEMENFESHRINEKREIIQNENRGIDRTKQSLTHSKNEIEKKLTELDKKGKVTLP